MGFALKVMGSSLLFVFSPTCFSSFDKWGSVPWWALGDCQVNEQRHNLKELHFSFLFPIKPCAQCMLVSIPPSCTFPQLSRDFHIKP